MEKIQFPKYKCHKEVRACKIDIVEYTEDNRFILHFTGYDPIEVAGDFIGKHKPARGKYYVIYDDGYTSISPAKAFEEGYTKL